jgi:uncharacterized NAD(P)/FAD-binding protein YdhS
VTTADRVVVVVGAGFCGAAVAAHLLTRGAGRHRLRVLIADKSGRMGRGLAYGTRSEQHVLNVPVGRMSALADDPDDFLRFVAEQEPGVTGASFVSRQLYGEYLEFVLERAAAFAAPGASLERIVGEVTGAVPTDDGRALVRLGGERIAADRVVLAVGNYAPAHPPIADRTFVGHPAYVGDPWLPGALEVVRRDAPVLLIGTGLTMIDIALDLRARGRTAPMIAVSRRGLLPLAHRDHGAPPDPLALPSALVDGPHTAHHYARAVRAWVGELAARGIDWRDAFVALRPATAGLWHRLDARERARFLRHLRPFWEVHRHRAAPRPAALLARMIRDGELEALAARLVAIRPGPGGLEVELRRRGQAEAAALSVGAVVNCTGPCTDVRDLDEPLVNALRAQGLVRPDPLGLGAEVDADCALVDAGGRPSRLFAVVGPLLRARDWEATAVPELRVHAARVAERIARELSASPDRAIAAETVLGPG